MPKAGAHVLIIGGTAGIGLDPGRAPVPMLEIAHEITHDAR